MGDVDSSEKFCNYNNDMFGIKERKIFNFLSKAGIHFNDLLAEDNNETQR